MHGACGLLGLLAVGFFTTKEYSYALNDNDDKEYGIFYGGSGQLLAIQLSGALIIVAWTLTTSIPLFMILKCSGIFRVPLHIEEVCCLRRGLVVFATLFVWRFPACLC